MENAKIDSRVYLDQGIRVMEEGKIQNEILFHESARYSQKEDTKPDRDSSVSLGRGAW